MYFQILILLLSIICSLPTVLFAQWKNIGANLLGNIDPYGAGVIRYFNGQLWAGYKTLWVSKDTGSSWTKLPLNLHGAAIRDIKFFNESVGLIAVEDGGVINGGVYLTNDGGQTWSHILPITYCWALDFAGSADDIVVCQNFGGEVYMTHDRGLIWRSLKLNEYGLDIHSLHDGKIMTFFGNLTSCFGHLYISSDRGDSWIPKSDSIDMDSYSFTVDSLNQETVYLANEEFGAPFTNKISELFVSKSGGDSWKLYTSFPQDILISSVANSRNAVFYQTSSNTSEGGVYRFTKCDTVAHSIGGPYASGDCRLLCVVNDNFIIAGDLQGNIWCTINSGGDSLRGDSFKTYSIETSDQSTDTIGGEVHVPISIQGIESPSMLQCVLHYDTVLIYEGSTNLDAVQIDIPKEQWRGRSKLSIKNASPGRVLGYCNFTILANTQSKPKVWFDSLTIVGEPAPCSTTQNMAISIITPPSGCGVSTISNFMMTGKIPIFFMYPNPATGNLTIESSQSLEATIEVTDRLGRECFETTQSFKKSEPTLIDITTVTNGMYLVRFKTNTFISSQTLIVQK